MIGDDDMDDGFTDLPPEETFPILTAETMPFNTISKLTFETPVAVLGDIHGSLDLLDRLLVQIGDMPILVLGDLCDRGPDSKGVIDRLIERKAQGVHGNHDEWLVRLGWKHQFDPFALSQAMGGKATLDSYGFMVYLTYSVERNYLQVPRNHVGFLQTLALASDLTVMGQKYWLTHGGLPVNDVIGAVPEDQRIILAVQRYSDSMLWGYNRPEKQYKTDRTLIMGHICHRDPVDLGHVMAIDTGAGTTPRTGALTAVILPERRFITVRP